MRYTSVVENLPDSLSLVIYDSSKRDASYYFATPLYLQTSYVKLRLKNNSSLEVRFLSLQICYKAGFLRISTGMLELPECRKMRCASSVRNHLAHSTFWSFLRASISLLQLLME